MKILVKYPSRERPDKFKSVLKRYSETAITDIKFLVSLDETDPTLKLYLHNKPYIKHEVDYFVGDSKTKIQAINADIYKYDKEWDILVLASDDMIPVVEGWDERIIEDMTENYPDLDGVLYYYDGHQPLNTMPIMGRKYYERFNYIYDPAFISLWCDNLFELQADALGKQTRFKDVIFEHQCWFNGKGQKWQETNDPLMKRNQSYFQKDRDTFYKRKAELGL